MRKQKASPMSIMVTGASIDTTKIITDTLQKYVTKVSVESKLGIDKFTIYIQADRIFFSLNVEGAMMMGCGNNENDYLDFCKMEEWKFDNLLVD